MRYVRVSNTFNALQSVERPYVYDVECQTPSYTPHRVSNALIYVINSDFDGGGAHRCATARGRYRPAELREDLRGRERLPDAGRVPSAAPRGRALNRRGKAVTYSRTWLRS